MRFGRITRSFSESSEESDEMYFLGELLLLWLFRQIYLMDVDLGLYTSVSGEGIINFFSEGDPGMPVSGKTALCHPCRFLWDVGNAEA